MKKTSLLVLLASTLFYSCGSLSSFESPNSLRNMAGTLYLLDGKSFEGKMVIRTGNLFGPEVKLYEEGAKAPLQFDLRNVRGYRMGDDYYALKIREEGFGIGKMPLFMKQLTPDGSRIHLYEAQEKEPSSGKGSQSLSARYQTNFYIAFPSGETVHSINGPALVPHFEQKMSAAVADCPALARKITAKESGYFYAQVSLIKTHDRDVLLRIIDEYSRCGSSK